MRRKNEGSTIFISYQRFLRFYFLLSMLQFAVKAHAEQLIDYIGKQSHEEIHLPKVHDHGKYRPHFRQWIGKLHRLHQGVGSAEEKIAVGKQRRQTHTQSRIGDTEDRSRQNSSLQQKGSFMHPDTL